VGLRRIFERKIGSALWGLGARMRVLIGISQEELRRYWLVNEAEGERIGVSQQTKSNDRRSPWRPASSGRPDTGKRCLER